MVQLTEHFASEGPGRTSEWARQRQWFIKAKHDHQRREGQAEKLDDTTSALSAAVAFASEVQIAEFKVKLDTYDKATVEALMKNQELLDEVQARLEDLRDRAYVLEDGRRVFRTEDGAQVFDEYGTEVGQDEIDPIMIGDDRPSWEAFSEGLEQEAALTAERTQILEFQDEVDAARERVDGGEISEAELAELDAELLEMMPDAVRGHADLAPVNDVAAPDADNSVSAPPSVSRVVHQGIAAVTPTPL
ncbi:MAG: hypothetical protein ABJL67_15840 [Sulfitobacter sp.]